MSKGIKNIRKNKVEQNVHCIFGHSPLKIGKVWTQQECALKLLNYLLVFPEVKIARLRQAAIAIDLSHVLYKMHENLFLKCLNRTYSTVWYLWVVLYVPLLFFTSINLWILFYNSWRLHHVLCISLFVLCSQYYMLLHLFISSLHTFLNIIFYASPDMEIILHRIISISGDA